MSEPTVRQPGDGPILGPGAKGDPLRPEVLGTPETVDEPTEPVDPTNTEAQEA